LLATGPSPTTRLRDPRPLPPAWLGLRWAGERGGQDEIRKSVSRRSVDHVDRLRHDPAYTARAEKERTPHRGAWGTLAGSFPAWRAVATVREQSQPVNSTSPSTTVS
jgi:hypothetical protein